MPGALTQAISLGVFLFATFGNQFTVDLDDYEGVPWREMIQGAVAAGSLFLATISALAFTQKELTKAYGVLKPLFNMRSAARNVLTLPTVPAQSCEESWMQRCLMIASLCLRLTVFMFLMVVTTCVVALILADTPGWSSFINNLPLDSTAKLLVALCTGLKSFIAALGVKMLEQLTSTDSFVAKLLPASMASVCAYTGTILVEMVHALSVLSRNVWLLVSVPLNYVSDLPTGEGGPMGGPLKFFLGWVCWHGGYLMPWQPYSVGAGIATKRAIHGAADSLTSELSVLAYPCMTAMAAMSILMSVFGMKLLGPSCAKYRAVYRVSQFHLLIGVVCATHIFCFFSFDTVRALVLRGHPMFGLDDIPEHDNFNWISSSIYDPLNPTNVHTLARPLQLFCDMAVAATMLTMGYLYRDPAGGSIFRRRRRSSVEMDVTSCSAAVDDSPVCSAAGIVSNDARASSDLEDEERAASHSHEHPEGAERSLEQVREETGHDEDNDSEEECPASREHLERGEMQSDDEEPVDEESDDEEAALRVEASYSENSESQYEVTDGDSVDGSEREECWTSKEEGPSVLRSVAGGAPFAVRNICTPMENKRMITRSASRTLQQQGQSSVAYAQSRDPPHLSAVSRTVARDRELEELLATAPRTGGHPTSISATPAAPHSAYSISKPQRTQVAVVDRSHEEAGTGGQDDTDRLQRDFSKRAFELRRGGHLQSGYTSQSSASRRETGSDTSLDPLLKPAPQNGPMWSEEARVANIAQDNRTQTATQKNLNAVGRHSMIPTGMHKRPIQTRAARATTNENNFPRRSPFARGQ